MLGTRVIVGFVLAVLAIVITVHGGYWFAAMMVLVGLLGLNEFYRLMRRYRPIPLAGFAGLLFMAALAWWRSPVAALGATAVAALLTFLLAVVPGPRRGVSVRIAVTMLGLVWVGWGVIYLMFIHRLPEGWSLTLMVVFGTWAGDTVAYFTGRYFGATPMAPRLSPKKTWEGFAGGFIGTVLLVVLLGLYLNELVVIDIGPLQSFAIGLAIAVTAPLGDLFESLLKRDAEMKDAGRLLPGHGGVLDRFDGLFFASVASYYVILAVF